MIHPILLFFSIVAGCGLVACLGACLGQILCECAIECCYYQCDNWSPCYFNKKRRELVKDADLTVECPICQQKTVDIITECKHLYHRECLIKWSHECKEKLQPVTCPLCRTPINKAYPVFILDRIA